MQIKQKNAAQFIVFTLFALCVQFSIAEEPRVLSDKDRQLLQQVVESSSDLFPSVPQIALHYTADIEAGIKSQVELKLNGNRVYFSTRFSNPTKTVWLFAFDGEQYQELWKDGLLLSKNPDKFKSSLNSLWGICPLTMMFTFLRADEDMSKGFTLLADSGAWADLMRRATAVSEVSEDGGMLIRVVLTSDYGPKFVYFDPKRNYYPIKLELADATGTIKSVVIVKKLAEIKLADKSFRIPVEIIGKCFEKGRESSYTYAVDEKSILTSAPTGTDSYRLPTGGASKIRDVDLDIYLKERESLENTTPLLH